MSAPVKLSRSAANTIRRMIAGELFYASELGPRLRPRIRDEIVAAGFLLQREQPLGESSAYYPLDRQKFVQLAYDRGLIDDKIRDQSLRDHRPSI